MLLPRCTQTLLSPGIFLPHRHAHLSQQPVLPCAQIFWTYNPYCSWPLPDFVPPGRWANISTDYRKRDWDCGCIFRALFRFSDELEGLIDEEMERVFPNGAWERRPTT